MSEVYDFDEFFIAPDDPGVEVLVPIRGKMVPIKIKRGVNLTDHAASQAKAVTQKILPNGKFDMSVDEGAYTNELLNACIKSWPFTKAVKDAQGRVVMDENGDPRREPVPVTRENIALMLRDGASYLQQVLLGMIEAKRSALPPFESPSGAAS